MRWLDGITDSMDMSLGAPGQGMLMDRGWSKDSHPREQEEGLFFGGLGYRIRSVSSGSSHKT